MRVGSSGEQGAVWRDHGSAVQDADDLTLSAEVDVGDPLSPLYRKRHRRRHRLHPPHAWRWNSKFLIENGIDAVVAPPAWMNSGSGRSAAG